MLVMGNWFIGDWGGNLILFFMLACSCFLYLLRLVYNLVSEGYGNRMEAFY